jgi:hypothetical protein
MQCIVFTDSIRLAEKYRTSRQDVLDLLQKNLKDSDLYEFLFLDAIDYRDELGQTPSWQDYKLILADFIKGMGIEPSPKTSLFIIGGDDVIPMPRMQNPIEEKEELTADFLYCFAEDEPSCLDAEKAQCNVGRLPLENGMMSTSLQDDLQSYFNLSMMMLQTGIEVNNVVMTSTQSWLPASNEMVRGLPIEEPRHIADATKENMYTSPRLAVEEERVVHQYKNDIGKADMLMFNLHGSDMPRYSSFFGEGANGHNTPEAFTIDYLRDSGARIFNTVACFGGRFINYKRNESMLLSSLYGGGVVLYAGSCTSALGRSGIFHDEAQDILTPAGFSESFMKLYTLYLFRGISAGEAFLRAKCDYFNTCHELDGDEPAIATIWMFNLYGLPLLCVNRCDEVTQEARGLKEAHLVDWGAKTEYRTIFEKNGRIKGSVIEEVRMRVDENLHRIRRVVESQLYQYWGLSSANLYSIKSVSKRGVPKGFRFEYLDESNVVKKRVWAYADVSGKVKDVVHFK